MILKRRQFLGLAGRLFVLAVAGWLGVRILKRNGLTWAAGCGRNVCTTCLVARSCPGNTTGPGTTEGVTNGS
jgi:hypothetical protein